MSDFAEIENLITNSLPGSIVEISDLTGNKDHLHLGVTVASDHFAGKTLIEQHQMIMDILKSKLKANEIHAVKIKTKTP